MGIIEERKALRDLYEKYRAMAKKLYEDVGMVDSQYIKISEFGNIRTTEKGAFVDALIWIPKDKL